VSSANEASGVKINKGYTAHSSAPQPTLANHGAWYGIDNGRSPPAGIVSPQGPCDERSQSLVPGMSACPIPEILIALRLIVNPGRYG
jgi:hypothetical protein